MATNPPGYNKIYYHMNLEVSRYYKRKKSKNDRPYYGPKIRKWQVAHRSKCKQYTTNFNLRKKIFGMERLK